MGSLPSRPSSGRVRSPAARANARRGWRSVFVTLTFLLALGLLAVSGTLFTYVYVAASLPAPEELRARVNTFASTRIYDRTGALLYEVADPEHGRRTSVPLAQISPHLIDATLATEDPNFFAHPGVDPIGVARAIYYALKEGNLSGPGGSTITQQLVKLAFLSSERTAARKIKEAILAAEITRRYSKETILQIYLNEIYYGNLAYGVEAAAQTYFGKPARELTLPEAALLAGLPQAPAYYDPYTNLWQADGVTPGPAKERQRTVLRLMAQYGYVTPSAAEAAWRAPLTLKPLQQTYALKAPHFVFHVRGEIERTLGPEFLARGGLEVHTTLDPRLQAIAEEEIAARVAQLADQDASNGALVAVRPTTSEVLAMVGSADFHNAVIAGQINMATAPRQPGSAIKPLTYLAAFELEPPLIDDNTRPSDALSALEPAGYWTPATAILDIRTEFPDGANPPYVPSNYDGKEHGIVSVRAALANSYNIPAVKALQHIGLDRLRVMAARLGITTLIRPDYGLSLTLGGGEVTLLEMTGAYATLANGGMRAPLTSIACILTADGVQIWRSAGAETIPACDEAAARGGIALLIGPAAPQQVVDPQLVFLITSILSDLEARRPAFGRSAELLSLPDRPAAAKTGTTNDYRDAWTLGYTPDLAVGVWVGNADYRPMRELAGALGAGPIWHNVMQRALEGTPPQPFAEPPGIQRIEVCADSGTLPSPACPARRVELFAAKRGPLPARFDLHQRLAIDKVTGKLATEFTPLDRIEERDFVLFPPRYRAWAEAHGFPQIDVEPPAYAFAPELALRSPASGERVAGMVAIDGHVHLPDPLVWRVEYGVGPNPIGWGIVAGPTRGDGDGVLAQWDAAAAVARHDVRDFSLRLAAYDPANFDYPAAASNAVYVFVDLPASPTPIPVIPSPTPIELPSPTALASPTLVELATPVSVTTTPVSVTTTPELSVTIEPTATEPPPPAPAPPTDTPPSVEPSPTPTLAPPIQAAIIQPAAGARVSCPVLITGVADGGAFQSYQLHFAPGDAPAGDVWLPVEPAQAVPSSPARESGGMLGVWRCAELAPGIYTLRLGVWDTSGAEAVATAVVEIVPP